MLLPDNVHPHNTIYYNSCLLLEQLNITNNISFIDLYSLLKEGASMSIHMYILCLDWLYLIELVVVDEQGKVKKCI